MENKYRINITFKNGTGASYVGVGRPSTTIDELHIKSPEGKEIIVMKNDVKVFVVSEYKED